MAAGLALVTPAVAAGLLADVVIPAAAGGVQVTTAQRAHHRRRLAGGPTRGRRLVMGGHCNELDEGDGLDEALRNAKEAITLHLEAMIANREPVAAPSIEPSPPSVPAP